MNDIEAICHVFVNHNIPRRYHLAGEWKTMGESESLWQGSEIGRTIKNHTSSVSLSPSMVWWIMNGSNNLYGSVNCILEILR
jgi:hypothetical protein